MARTDAIWKTELDIVDTQEVTVPWGARPLSVGFQDGQLCMWFYCDPAVGTGALTIHVYGTGNKIPKGRTEEYVGTVHHQVNGQNAVWHVFREEWKR